MDGMIEICSNKHAKEACVASDKDPFETLPEDVLQYLLSFLPSRDVVQTCVLARRWHSLWKAVPSLLINTDDEKEETYKSAQALNKFVHNLLLSRERVPLHICKINSFDSDDTDEAPENIEYWLRYAVSCQVQVLGVYVRGDEELLLPLSNVPLISAHLTRLEFKSVEFSGCSLDFSTCPALKVLKVIDCAMEVERISSQSLTHLIINGGRFLVINARTRISVPSLVVLELANFEGYTPLLECMPSLVRAFLRFAFYGYCYDRCDNGNYFGNCGSCERCCYGRNGDNNDCILLEALSGVTNLELLSPPELFICRMDFKHDHMFSNLKTLLLGEWCVAANFSGLIYFVQHSPILERITLQLGFEIVKKRLGFDEEPMDDETVESYIPKEQFVISKHLKVVKIKFDKEDERIHQTVEILSTLGVLPEQIYIERTACSVDLERHLFDGMAEIRNNKHAKEACVASDKDPFETLPEDVLQYLLSFLPSRDVVRTCMLARRWRTLWKTVPSLLINTDDEKEETYKSAYALNKFVHNLLLSRERVPLYVCKITSYGADDTDPDEALKYIESWLRYAVSCQVQELQVYIRQQELILPLCDVPLVSTHLTRLDLKFVEFWGCSLDFSTCPALKVLKAEDCTPEVERISSQSLTHLIINGGSFLVINGRTRISVPSLIVLELTNYEGYAPVLDCMPSLVRAFLRFGCLDGYCDDCYENGNYLENCRSCAGSCYGRNDDNNDCVLLEALSGATNLEMISPPELFICRMDFDECNHMFSNLKTLSLGEWGVADDFSALIYFVLQSPILERITLQLGYKLLKDKLRFDEEPMDETAESYIPLEQFVVSKHLKVVKIKCHKEDERIHQIVKIISTLGVLPEHIYIERTAYTSELERFSFQQRDENFSSEQAGEVGWLV